MKSPFKFLDSYTKDDREIFFGRNREIEELYQRVFDSKILLVYGVSGTGKSSLIHCGLANKFSETDWLPIVIRRGGNIIDSLTSGIKSVSITEQQNRLATPGDFKKAVRSLYLDHYKPVFFIFDQFEELFIFGDKEDRRSFIHIVKALTESDLQCRMIFVMREEYMAGVTEFEKFIPTFFANRVRIEKMSHVNALEAIKEPCKVFNISLEEGFAETLLEKLSPGETDVELTYLQVFLDKVFRLATGFLPHPGGESKGGLAFTLKHLSQVGNVSDLLGSFLEEQLKALDEPDAGLTILKSFVSIKGTKKQQTQQEVIESSKAFGKDIPADKVSDLLLKFVNLRILRDKDENGRFELRHDSLATKIYEKITLVEKELMEINQFLENALLSYQKRKILLNTNDFKYLAPYEDSLFVNKETATLMEISRNELNKGKKRIKRAAIAGFVAIMIISLGAFMKLYHWPFNNSIRQLGYIIYVVWFLPLFTFYVVKTKENRAVNLIFLIFTLFFLGYNYVFRAGVLSGIRASLSKPLNQTARHINLMIENYNHDSDSIFKIIEQKSKPDNIESLDSRKKADELRKKTNDLDDYMQNIKIKLVKYVEGAESGAIKYNNIDMSEIIKLDENNIPSEYLIGSNGDGKAFELKSLLQDHKVFLKNISDNNPNISKKLDQLVNLNDRLEDPKKNELERWENYTFQTKNLGFTLITLSQYQHDLKYLESEVLTYMYNKMLAEIEQKSK